jgi:hypothetical protein
MYYQNLSNDIDCEEITKASTGFIFMLSLFVCTSLTFLHRIAELELQKKVINSRKLLGMINYRFDLFNNELIEDLELEKMIEEMESFSDSEVESEEEEAAKILYGMSRGNNWEY